METTAGRVALDELTDTVVEKLIQAGQLANLGAMTLETLEGEVVEKMDRLTRGVISTLLTKQAEQTERPECCPRCSGPLGQKPAQGRSLQSRRGTVHFKCDVFRCEACRLDFFPSVQNTRL